MMKPHRWIQFVLLLAVVTLCAAAINDSTKPARQPNASTSTVRGMTISCPGSGRIWGSDAMVETMADLNTMGVNWIAIHPYGGIRMNGEVVMHDRMYGDSTWLTRPIKEAHRLGMKIMIKPHISYWGSGFDWRGAITFETEEQWQRFFESYERWITHVVEVCKDADAFVVGTELDRTVHHKESWRKIIASVRERTKMPLTYSANWDSFEKVPFWSDLDVIGIQAYFPLVHHDQPPTSKELDKAWKKLVNRLEKYGRRFDKKILLAELGYNRSSIAAKRPWEYRQGGTDAEETQRRCMTAALKALNNCDGVVGSFLWKWFPNQGNYGNFLMSTPAMREVIESNWKSSEPRP